ncbi:MAG: methyltransferase domain-containing protein [Candidatus Ryanbacteria bacterium]|nr:methyltransferase domain-containing protein [Candidatus Ryanbacteria bacterium]
MENNNEKPKFTERELEFVEEGREMPSGEHMLRYLGLSWDDLRDKVVVDLGAAEASLAKEAEKRGIHGVVSIDKNDYGQAIRERKNYVRGELENIPLKDNSIDLFLSSHVFSLRADEETKNVLLESSRVMKDGSKMLIWPAILGYPQMKEVEEKKFAEELEKELQELVSNTYDVHLKRSPIAKGEYFYADYFWELTRKSKETPAGAVINI